MMDAISTQTDTYAMHTDMARDARFPERITLPMLEGWTARIDAAREPDETRLDVIREAIDRELRRRKAKKSSDD